jgi:hypothetical protein
MKISRLWINSLVALSFVAAIASVACKWYEARYPIWREEVRLSDGRSIIVTQKHEYYEDYGTNQAWVTFSLPEMGGERTWHSYLKPMRIDVIDGVVYVFGRPRGDRQVKYYQYPRHYLVAFKWDGNSFARVPFLSLPSDFRRRENIFPCIPDSRGSLITWPQKEANWCAASDSKGLLTREIDLQVYERLAIEYARRDGGVPLTD